MQHELLNFRRGHWNATGLYPPMITLNALGADQMFAHRSGCAYWIPVSTTATTLSDEPVDEVIVKLRPTSGAALSLLYAAADITSVQLQRTVPSRPCDRKRAALTS